MTQRDDLDRALSDAIAKTTGKMPAPPAAASRRRIGLTLHIALWAVAVGAWAWQLAPRGPGDAEVRAELLKLVGEARDGVRAFMNNNGRLPSRLPDASLTPVVSYSPAPAPGTSYTLEGRIGGVTERWSGDVNSGGSQ